MINYSILPPELVFENWDNFEPEFETIEVDGELSLEVERLDPNKVKISRIISSNPHVYLNNSYTPGTILNLIIDSNKS